MRRFMKIVVGIAGVLLVLVLLGITVGVILVRFIDPNAFKPRLVALARQHAGWDLSIPGSLEWTFWPYVGIDAGRIEIRTVDTGERVADFDAVRVRVAVRPLLRRRIELAGLHLTGLELAATGIRLDATVRTDMDMDLERGRFDFQSLDMDVSLAGLTPLAIPLTARARVELDLHEDRIGVRDVRIDAAGVHASGALEVTGLAERPVIAGRMRVDPFDAQTLLAQLGVPPLAVRDPDAWRKVEAEVVLSGPENSFVLDPLMVRVDDSRLSGSAGIADLETGAIVFDLVLDRLALDRYLPVPASEAPEAGEYPERPLAPDDADSTDSSEQVAETGIVPPETRVAAMPGTEDTASPDLADAALLPLDVLRGIDLQGRLRMDSLRIDTLETGSLTLAVRARDGLIELHETEARIGEGRLQLAAALDARTDTPALRANALAQAIQIQPFMQLALAEDVFSGVLNLTLDATAEGNSQAALLEHATGSLDLTLAQGTIRGVNLLNLLTAGIREMLDGVPGGATLMSRVDVERLARQLKDDTEFVTLRAMARIEDRKVHVEALTADLDYGSLDGRGVLDLRREAFDFRLAMRVPDLTENRYLADQAWPLRCRGKLADSPVGWFGVDREGLREIGRDVAARLAKDALRDRLGIEADGATAREVIESVVSEVAGKEEVKEAVDNLKEDVRRRVDEGLRRLVR